MDAVTDDHQNAGRGVAVVVRTTVIMTMIVIVRMVMPVIPMNVLTATIGVRVPPEHELLDDKEDSESHQE